MSLLHSAVGKGATTGIEMLISQVPEIGGAVLLGKQRRRSAFILFKDNQPLQSQTRLDIEEDSKCKIIFELHIYAATFNLHLVNFCFGSSRSLAAAWRSNQESSFFFLLPLPSPFPVIRMGLCTFQCQTATSMEPLEGVSHQRRNLSLGVQLGLAALVSTSPFNLPSSLVNHVIDYPPSHAVPLPTPLFSAPVHHLCSMTDFVKDPERALLFTAFELLPVSVTLIHGMKNPLSLLPIWFLITPLQRLWLLASFRGQQKLLGCEKAVHTYVFCSLCMGVGGSRNVSVSLSSIYLDLFKSIWVVRYLAWQSMRQALPQKQAVHLSQDSSITSKEFPERLSPQAVRKPGELAQFKLQDI